MQKPSLFDEAKKYITAELIKEYCHHGEGSVISGKELRTYNPMRPDNHPGSFSINLSNGLWHDDSGNQGGNFFQLISKVDCITAYDAAKKILSRAGIEWKQQSKRKKPTANRDIPETAFDSLKDFLNKDWIKKRYGKQEGGWKFINHAGQIEYIQVRYITGKIKKDGKPAKDDIPFYYSKDDTWEAGLPPNYKQKKLPLYNENLITSETHTVILVEGCKCGKIAQENTWPGIIFLSWGGTSQHNIRTWKILQDHRCDLAVIIWPDKDLKYEPDEKLMPIPKQPGMQAALAIKKKYLPWAEILDIYAWDTKNEKPDTWDIADAIKEKLDIQEIIETCPRYTAPEPIEKHRETPPTENNYFHFLGFSREAYFFMPRLAPFPISVKHAQVKKTFLLNLAPLEWWFTRHPGDSGPRWDAATDWVIQQSQAAGWFDPKRIKSAGIWKIGDKIVCNTGRELLTPEGEELRYGQLDGDYTFVQSPINVKSVTAGRQATDQEGQALIDLFEAQGFESRLQAWEALGWALSAPFGGLLPWRPGMWITGASQTGKSFVIENLMQPLACEFQLSGSSKTTVASLKRDAGTDSRAVFLDEMESRGQNSRYASQKIQELIEMVRDAACNTSNTFRQMGRDGVDEYAVYSFFCFSSILEQLPSEAFQNRFFTPTLDRKIRVRDKRVKTHDILKTGLLKDPGIFLRRNFANIRQIISNIEYLKNEIGDSLCSQRTGDNYAPVFAFIFALQNTGDITPEFVNDINTMLAEISEKESALDEDILLDEILSVKLRIGPEQEKTVRDIIYAILINSQGSYTYEEILQNHGIYYTTTEAIAISYNNRYIREWLQGTDYAMGYGGILKRHPLAKLNKGKCYQVKRDGHSARCVCFTREDFLTILAGPDE